MKPSANSGRAVYITHGVTAKTKDPWLPGPSLPRKTLRGGDACTQSTWTRPKPWHKDGACPPPSASCVPCFGAFVVVACWLCFGLGALPRCRSWFRRVWWVDRVFGLIQVHPALPEVINSCQQLGLPLRVEFQKKYSRDFFMLGRVRFLLFKDDGSLFNAAVPNSTPALLLCGRACVRAY